eukprot:3933287-Rhodomonas_salina.1
MLSLVASALPHSVIITLFTLFRAAAYASSPHPSSSSPPPPMRHSLPPLLEYLTLSLIFILTSPLRSSRSSDLQS